MCMANPGLASAAADNMGPRNRTAANLLQRSVATNPSYVRSVYDEGGSAGFERKFGAYHDNSNNPWGKAAYQTLAKQQGREFDPKDLYGEKAAATAKEAALNERIAALESQQQSRAQLGTISTSQAASVKTPSTNTRTPQRVRPIRSSLKTTSGVKQIPTASSLSGGMGLNVPN
jgi:hypothetical protein